MSVQDKTRCFISGVIRAVAPHACAFKVQKAFYDVLPDGAALLRETIATAREYAPRRPVYIDSKIGDVANTMLAYTEHLFAQLDADGAVVIPYLGADVLQPFLAHPKRAALVVVRSSNNGASGVQDALLAGGQPLWKHVLAFVRNANGAGNIIPILSAAAFCESHDLPDRWPVHTPVLLAGFGAQGGVLSPSSNTARFKVFASSSRQILYPGEAGSNWIGEVALAAKLANEYLGKWATASQDVMRP